MYNKFFEFDKFQGIDNVSDPTKIPFVLREGKTYLREAVNVNINDELMISRAKGIDLLYPGSFHSFWSNKDQTFGLCIQNGILYKIEWNQGSESISLTEISSDLSPDARMKYVETDDRIFMTNGSFIGYYKDGILNALPDPNLAFKVKMPAGHLIEFYNNQLYVAVNNMVIHSDSSAWHRMDERFGITMWCASRVRMIQAVETGLFISDDSGIYYLHGGISQDLIQSKKLHVPILSGGFQKIGGEMLTLETPISGDVIAMMTSEGIFIGGPNGLFIHSTKGRYVPVNMDEVSGFYRSMPDLHQVVFIGSIVAEIKSADMEFQLPLFNVDIS